MPRIELITEIRASRERCFDLSRDIDLHVESMTRSGERAIRGTTTGLIGEGEEVTWQARHFGVLHEHSSRITMYDRPTHFRDSMVAGRFRRFDHDHTFEDAGDGVTRMLDVVEFDAPFGPLGWIVERLVLTSYLEGLIRERNEVIRRAAEGAVPPGPQRINPI